MQNLVLALCLCCFMVAVDVGMEAIWKVEVEDFPAFIVVDDKGNDFFKEWQVEQRDNQQLKYPSAHIDRALNLMRPQILSVSEPHVRCNLLMIMK